MPDVVTFDPSGPLRIVEISTGGDNTLTWEFDTKRSAPNVEAARVTVSGLRGGHSGGDIHENRGNAIKALVRTLLGAGINGLRIATIAGGS